jgi:hypothetical protein
VIICIKSTFGGLCTLLIRKNKGATRVDNPEKLATLGTQDEDKHKTICVKHHYEQTNTNNIKKTWASPHAVCELHVWDLYDATVY